MTANPYKVIRLVSMTGMPLPRFDGKYVVSYDPTKWRMRDVSSVEEIEALVAEFVTVTDDPRKARRFPNLEAAFLYWKQQVGPGSIRPWDGKPNRPLTAFHVTFEPAPTVGSTP